MEVNLAARLRRSRTSSRFFYQKFLVKLFLFSSVLVFWEFFFNGVEDARGNVDFGVRISIRRRFTRYRRAKCKIILKAWSILKPRDDRFYSQRKVI